MISACKGEHFFVGGGGEDRVLLEKYVVYVGGSKG
jgi:hypothetical protein